MTKIDLIKYPKIIQMHSSAGCIPVNIENALKYYGESNYDELKLLCFCQTRNIPLGFREFSAELAKILKKFEFIFKDINDFNHSIEKVITYIKSNIDSQIPVLVSFKQMIKIRIEAKNNPQSIKWQDKEVAHIRTAIEYNDNELLFFDPGDGEIKKFNYTTNEFSENIKGDYHTLVIKIKA
ncbi:MAG: C39 family peptidase [Candidatus Helarchaeota archaeon]